MVFVGPGCNARKSEKITPGVEIGVAFDNVFPDFVDATDIFAVSVSQEVQAWIVLIEELPSEFPDNGAIVVVGEDGELISINGRKPD